MEKCLTRASRKLSPQGFVRIRPVIDHQIKPGELAAGFEGAFQTYLRGPRGQFDMWMAAQEVRRAS